MMRPMKLAGSELMFGQGCLEHLKTLKGKRAFLVTSGETLIKTGLIGNIEKLLDEVNISHVLYTKVEPDPSFSTVKDGTAQMMDFKPDLIIAIGGGSAMDAAKAMWIYYEHPELTSLKDIMPPNNFPKLRQKAIFVCIPTTAGTASEVSRSIVITDDETHRKCGIGNMEMMPDIAICDPIGTVSMPAKITAETGIDALTHALEAYVSNRANFLSDILAEASIKDIFTYLPKAYSEGENLEYREKMLNASMTAGMSFTNVSLGIVHSMSQTLGGYFGLAHGLLNAIILPYVIEYNSKEKYAKDKYDTIAKLCGYDDLANAVHELNAKLHIPRSLNEVIPDKEKYMGLLKELAEVSLADGCTKTNPIIPSIDELVELFKIVYMGGK